MFNNPQLENSYYRVISVIESCKTKELSYINKMKDIDLMIEAFVEEERYEDCAFLVKIKDRIQDYYINKLKLEEL